MLRCVDRYVITDVSKERDGFIFRASSSSATKLRKKAVRFLETSVTIYHLTQFHTLYDSDHQLVYIRDEIKIQSGNWIHSFDGTDERMPKQTKMQIKKMVRPKKTLESTNRLLKWEQAIQHTKHSEENYEKEAMMMVEVVVVVVVAVVVMAAAVMMV